MSSFEALTESTRAFAETEQAPATLITRMADCSSRNGQVPGISLPEDAPGPAAVGSVGASQSLDGHRDYRLNLRGLQLADMPAEAGPPKPGGSTVHRK